MRSLRCPVLQSLACLALLLVLAGALPAQEMSGSELMPPPDRSATGSPGLAPTAAPQAIPGVTPKPGPVSKPASTPAVPADARPATGNAPAQGVPIGPVEPMPLPAPTTPAETPEMDPTTLGIVVLAMLIGGLVLLFLEVALIPGFGLTGITGIITILAGLGLAFWKLDTRLAVIYSLVSFVALVALVLWIIYVFPYTSLGKRFRLETKISVEDGYTAIRDLSHYVGKEGVATSDLRPSGIARIGDERLDVISDGEFVPRGTRIKVTKVKSGSIIVIPLHPPSPDS